MILASVTKHVKEQNWFAVGIDFFIVVVGVFMGIQVANWNESRANEKIVDAYIVRLQAEIQDENEAHKNMIDYLTTARAHGIAALEAFKQPAIDLDKEFLIDLYQASQTWNHKPSLSTYNELLATGRIALISDENVRKAVSGYFAGRRASGVTIENNMATAYKTTIRSDMQSDIQVQIRKKCGDIFIITQNSFTFLKLPENCDIELSDDVARSAIQKLHANANIQRDLTFHIGAIDTALASLKNGIKAGDKTLQQLKGKAP